MLPYSKYVDGQWLPRSPPTQSDLPAWPADSLPEQRLCARPGRTGTILSNRGRSVVGVTIAPGSPAFYTLPPDRADAGTILPGMLALWRDCATGYCRGPTGS